MALKPTPVPTPTTPKSVLSAQTQSSPSWNQLWNQGWNSGFNTPQGPSSQGGAFGTGFSAGQAEYAKRNQPTQSTKQNNMPSSVPTNNSNQGYGQINAQQDAGNAQIEADYNQSMGMLDNAQSGLQSQAGTANSTIDTGAGDARNQIQNTQGTAEAGANASLQTAEKQGTSAMQQARDVFRQTQQQNGAQLSALGISSSSVAEALAERLGVDVAKRIAGVTGSLQEVRQNTTNELGRIKTYYQGQIQTLTQHVADQKAEIQNSLVQGLNQINQARSKAASDKSAARSSLLSQTQNAIIQLTAQQQQFQQSLQQWAAQKSAALTPIVQDPNYLNNLIGTANTLNQQFSSQGFNFTPSVNVNAQGTMTGQISNTKPQVDQFGNPISQNATPTGQVTGNVGQPNFGKYPHDGFTY